MGQLPSILKELNNSESLLHIGGVLSGDKSLCKKFSGDEMNIVGWISSRSWNPNEKFCPECAELYRRGWAWKSPDARRSENLT